MSARDKVKGRMKILEEEVPPENTLAVKSGVGKILVIGPHVKGTTTKQHCTKLLEGFDDGEEFLLHGSVIALRSIELAAVERNRTIVLDDDGAQLTEFRQPLQVQSHLEMPRILVQLGHTQRT